MQRKTHETRAIECLNDATRALQLGRLIQANRSIAQARTHLASIGPNDGKRTLKLWRAVSKADRSIRAANVKQGLE